MYGNGNQIYIILYCLAAQEKPYTFIYLYNGHYAHSYNVVVLFMVVTIKRELSSFAARFVELAGLLSAEIVL